MSWMLSDPQAVLEIRELVRKWRAEAEETIETAEGPMSRRAAIEAARAMRDCADELERALNLD